MVIIAKQTLKVRDPSLPIRSRAHFPRSLCGPQRRCRRRLVRPGAGGLHDLLNEEIGHGIGDRMTLLETAFLEHSNALCRRGVNRRVMSRIIDPSKERSCSIRGARICEPVPGDALTRWRD
jgi:hypothetical protein